jgi:hypothetical protein
MLRPGSVPSQELPCRVVLDFCLAPRIAGNCQPDSAAALPARRGDGIPGMLIACRHSAQVGVFLDIECRTCRALCLLRWRDGHWVTCSGLSRICARTVLIGHELIPFR